LVTNRFTYEDGTTNLHFEYESTFSIDVGDYTPMIFSVDGSVEIDKLTLTSGLTVKNSDGIDTLMTIDEDGLTVTKLNGVLVSDYALTSSLSDLAALLNNYALTSSLANYVTSSSLTTRLENYVTTGMASEYVVLTTLSTILNNYALTSSLANYVTSSSLTSTLGSYALTSSLTAVSNRVTSLETKTTSLSYNASATTISNALRLPMGMSIDPTNTIVYYGTNVRIEKWWIAPWSSHVNDALILLDHINTSVYGNEVRMIDGRLNLFRHPGAWSHGVYVDVHLVHFGIELMPQIANISYVSYNVDGTEPHAREPRLAW